MKLVKSTRLICCVALCAICFVLSHAVAFAQGGSTGGVAGTVADPSGALVANATITLKSSESGQEFTTTTAGNGTFTIPSLGTGTYMATVIAPGFKQAVARDIKVDVGKTSTLTLVLEIGAATDVVNIVGAGAELLQTQSATVGQTITGRQIIEQPQASRDALDLVTLLPGVQTTGRPRTSTINGLPKGALNITIDGTDVQDNLISSQDGFFTFVRPRIDAIEEVTISTATPGAEAASDGAVQIKFVTRRGTNSYTGSLYEYHRNPWLNANYFFNNQGGLPRSRVLLNQYGGRLGGPISLPKVFNGKDRAFFFVNYEEFRLPEQQLRQRTILSPQAQAGLFQYVTTNGTSSINLLQLAQANGLPATVDPTVGGLLNQIRQSTSQGTVQAIPNSPNYQQFNFVGQGGQVRYFTTVRLDFNLSSKHQLENTWNYQEFGGKPVDFLNSTDPAFPGFPNAGGQDSQRWSNSTALRSTLTSTLVNEARFGLLGGISLFLGGVSASQFANQGGYDLNLNDLGITDATALEPTQGVLRGLRFYGNTANRRNTPSFNFSDNLTWVRGSHTLNLGGNWNLIKSFQENINQFVPSINFGIAEGDPAENLFVSSNFPGASAADLGTAAQLYATLVGRVANIDRAAFLEGGSYGLLGPQTARFTQSAFAFYAADAWRARPNLTLNYGLRWEPQLPVIARNRNFAQVSYADLFGASGAGNLFKPGTLTGRPSQLTELGEGESTYNADYNNFAPSVGFAWSPNFKGNLLKRALGEGGQTVLRGGYSMAFVREGLGAYISPIAGNPGGVVTVNRDTANGTLPIGTMLTNTAALAAPSFASAPRYPLTANIDDGIAAFDPKIKTGSVHSFTFGIQRELSKDTVLEVRYVGTRARDLWRRFSLNEVNLVENGFLNEFKLAQGNLLANQAAGRGNTFAYFGPNTGTAPLPITQAFLNGTPAAQAGNAALYTSTQYRNATRLAQLSPNNGSPLGLATFLNTGVVAGTDTFYLDRAVAAGLPVNFFVVNPGLRQGAVSLTANDINTSYDAMQVELRRRFSRGLLLQASYTWSKSLTNYYAASQTTLLTPLTLRPENEGLEHYRAPQDLRHALKLNWIYELPFGRGQAFASNSNGFVDRVIGGWAFHGTARVQSGRPFDFGNVQLVGMTASELQSAIKIRKDPSGNVFYLPDDFILNSRRAFNVSATSASGYSALGVPTGSYFAPANSRGCVQAFNGGCGFSRLILDGSRFVRFDLSAVKKVRITEQTNFEFRAEFLNAFNNINFLIGGTAGADVGTVAGTQAGGGFGRVTAAYQDISTTNDPGGRLIQFVLRLNF